MKIVIMESAGFFCGWLAGLLRQGNHYVVVASPATGVNAFTGDGLPEALEAADVVYDFTNPPSYDGNAAADFYSAATGNLLAAEAAAGVSHHVTLSSVGIDQLTENEYFQAKMLQEELLRRSGRPFTVLRSTQPFEFIGDMARSRVEETILRISPALCQPVAGKDLAETLALLAFTAPQNDFLELAGPEPFRLADLVRRVLEFKGDDRLVIADSEACYFGVKLKERSLLPARAPRIGPTSFEAWLTGSQSGSTAIVSELVV